MRSRSTSLHLIRLPSVNLAGHRACPLYRVVEPLRFSAPAGTRDVRIDWLRGLAMTCVIINHSRLSSLLSWFSYERLWVVTAAEVFVVLSGVVLGMVYGRRLARDGWRAVVRGLGRRALFLYSVFVGVTVSVLAMAAMGIDVKALAASDGHTPAWFVEPVHDDGGRMARRAAHARGAVGVRNHRHVRLAGRRGDPVPSDPAPRRLAGAARPELGALSLVPRRTACLDDGRLRVRVSAARVAALVRPRHRDRIPPQRDQRVRRAPAESHAASGAARDRRLHDLRVLQSVD